MELAEAVKRGIEAVNGGRPEEITSPDEKRSETLEESRVTSGDLGSPFEKPACKGVVCI